MTRRYGFRLKRIKRPETARDIAECARRQDVAAKVVAEIEARFPALNAANFAEANAYRERRTAELLAE